MKNDNLVPIIFFLRSLFYDGKIIIFEIKNKSLSKVTKNFKARCKILKSIIYECNVTKIINLSTKYSDSYSWKL